MMGWVDWIVVCKDRGLIHRNVVFSSTGMSSSFYYDTIKISQKLRAHDHDDNE